MDNCLLSLPATSEPARGVGFEGGQLLQEHMEELILRGDTNQNIIT